MTKHSLKKPLLLICMVVVVQLTFSQEMPDGNGLIGSYYNFSAKTTDYLKAERADKSIPDSLDLFDGDFAGSRIAPEQTRDEPRPTDVFDLKFNDILPDMPAAGDLNENGDYRYFAVRWEGLIRGAKTGDVTFYAVGDNGFRIWIGDMKTPKIDFWRDEWDVTKSARIPMVEDSLYKIKIEYFENVGGNYFTLEWTGDGSKNSIKRKWLYTDLKATKPLETTNISGNNTNNIVSYFKKNTLFIESGLLIQNFELFDISGQKVIAKTQLNQSNINVDVPGLENGIYILRINNQTTVKIVKR